MPTLSVVMSSYNDAPFIAQAISSVLTQSYADFEFLIVENGSTDESLHIITTFRDPRIKVQVFPVNQGGVQGINAAIAQATGEYVALLNSDDYFLPDKLRLQVQRLNSEPAIGAVFGKCRIITEQDTPHPNPDHNAFFRNRHLDRYGYLRYFFFHGNCLCHPTAMIRRELMSRVGPFDTRLRRMPDLDYWLRILLRSDIAVIDTELAAHRFMDDASNESGARPEVWAANAWEYTAILHHYLALDEQTFERTFHKDLPSRLLGSHDRRVQLGKLATTAKHVSGHAFGLRLLYEALTDHASGITASEIHELMGRLDIYGINARATSESLCNELRALQNETQQLQNETQQLQDAISALTSSKTYRYTAWGRRLYRFIQAFRHSVGHCNAHR